jgi:hypothetical protein
MNIYVYKKKSEELEKLILSMSERKRDKMISNIKDFCENDTKNNKIVKVSEDIYFYRINFQSRLIFSKVNDNIILLDVFYSSFYNNDIEINLNNLFPVLLILEFFMFMSFKSSIFIALIALTILIWVLIYMKNGKNK